MSTMSRVGSQGVIGGISPDHYKMIKQQSIPDLCNYISEPSVSALSHTPPIRSQSCQASPLLQEPKYSRSCSRDRNIPDLNSVLNQNQNARSNKS
mmetsp:Transcript_5338/g.9361  ORF Transcript_5338/g.9361 Transcript_5338/m.9361 type:complete len:95 (+) Transcript_5338:233-517(+)